MKLISWNVNGIRACIQKGFLQHFAEMDADFFCLQETKLQEGQLQLDLPGYYQYWCYAEKKGYSGTAIFTKHQPQAVSYGLGIPELDTEGRLITLTYPEFFLVTCYTPNAQQGLARLEHRMKWEDAFREYLRSLDSKKPVILCGDLNVAHQEIDLKNPAANRGSAGFSDEERAAFGKLLECGFTDTFRHLNPTATGAYSWWSYRFSARQNNAGWRIDYFLVSHRLQEALYKAPIYSDILGSDHCPVGLELDITCNGSIWKEKAEGEPRVVTAETTKAPKKSSKALQAGIAAGLLAIGFLMGHFLPPLFASPDPNATLSTSPSGYAALSTLELATLAVNLKELSAYGLGASSGSVMDVAEYGKLRNSYPFLLELEFRSDSLQVLRGIRDFSGDATQIRAAKALIVYYETHGFHIPNTDYASMSTPELVDLAVQIEELAVYGNFTSSSSIVPVLSEARYTQLQDKYPVLVELEVRQDLQLCLLDLIATSAPSDNVYAANALLDYYARIGVFDRNNGVADDYVSMSTLELAVRASLIPELATYYSSSTDSMNILTTERYDELRQRYPVLAELERRSDAVSKLYIQLTQYANTQKAVRAITVLIEYYSALPDTDANYASMTTQELVDIAVSIPTLASIGSPVSSTIMTDTIYDSLAQENPVLYELKRRTDLEECLSRAAQDAWNEQGPYISATPQKALAASCLMGYYTRIGLIGVDDIVPPSPDYTALSTWELIETVTAEQELISYCRTNASLSLWYDYFRRLYPALQELEQRTDKETVLTAYIFAYTTSSDQATVAKALLSYYATFYPLGEICWVYSETENYTVYEYTQAPTYSYIYGITDSVLSYTKAKRGMTFGNEMFIVEGVPEWVADSNFWLRVEIAPDMLSYFTSNTEALTMLPPGTNDPTLKLAACPYTNTQGKIGGYMVFGITEQHNSVYLILQPTGLEAWEVRLFTTPPAPKNATTRELLEYAISKTNLMKYIQEECDQDICTYLPLKLLLEREDFFDTAMNVYQEERIAGNDSPNSFMSRIKALLSRPEVEALMTSGQRDTWDMLLGQPYG